MRGGDVHLADSIASVDHKSESDQELPMPTEVKKCAHELCTCSVADAKFCSQACEDAAAISSVACDCPHAGCGGRAV